MNEAWRTGRLGELGSGHERCKYLGRMAVVLLSSMAFSHMERASWLRMYEEEKGEQVEVHTGKAKPQSPLARSTP
jgi:hypothetical protein